MKKVACKMKRLLKFNWLVNIATISAILGLGILIYFFYLIVAAGLLIGKEINLEIANNIGSFVGGLVGSFWTLTGVLLYYSVIKAQRKESDLAEQRYKAQIDLLNVQKFQASFFELYRIFQNQLYVVSNLAQKPNGFSEPEYAFDNASYKAHMMASFYSKVEFSNLIPLAGVSDPEIFYKEKMTVLLNMFLFIMKYTEMLNDKNKEDYQMIVIEPLTNDQILSLIYLGIYLKNENEEWINFVNNNIVIDNKLNRSFEEQSVEIIFWSKLKEFYKSYSSL
ncbi:MAG: hypothetical protein VB072_12555 [Lentimicrobium sp.]|nr:hypothetical protein [Lentimicrobium sp.]